MNSDSSESIAVPPIIATYEPGFSVPAGRIESLDVLRGFAILGILIMNIQGFSMIEAAYMNPTAYGDLSGVNFVVWLLSHVFAEQKFMSIFSMLFGAGIVLMADRNRAAGKSVGSLHYRRMFWLLLFGMAHAYLFWYGDILVTYALAGAVAFLFRNVRPRLLLLWSVVALAIPSILFALLGLASSFWPPEAIRDLQSQWQPNAGAVQTEVQLMQGPWVGQVVHRMPTVIMFQTVVVLAWSGWRAGGLMLLGMALLKWGFLSGELEQKKYLGIAARSFFVGLPLILFGVYRNFQENWFGAYSFFLGYQWNYWGSLGLAIGYCALLVAAYRAGVLTMLRNAFANLGRMALTNYLLQTLICTTIFYGHGFGLYGRLERWQQALTVIVVWLLQIIFTRLWLRFYPQGPFEMVWRSLTYWQLPSLLPSRRRVSPAGD